MRNGIHILLIGCLLTTLVATVQTNTRPAQAAIVANCNCGKATCGRCGPKRANRCRKCPKCETDVCQLNAECVKEKKTCFEVEQKLICVPAISLPWRKCKQPCNGDCAGRCRKKCGKTKTVNVLKTKTYECPTCKYTWELCEPELVQPDEYQEQQLFGQPQPLNGNVEQPGFEQNQLFDPGGGDVPTAPQIDRK